MINDKESSGHARRERCIRLFIRRMIFCIIAIAVVLTISFIIVDTPILTNQVAMGQMENSNDWFVAMAMYQKFVPIVEAARNILVSIIVGLLAWSGYDLAKSLNT